MIFEEVDMEDIGVPLAIIGVLLAIFLAGKAEENHQEEMRQFEEQQRIEHMKIHHIPPYDHD